MSFLAPFALFSLIALPLVVGLHLFRRRFRQRRAAGLFLFAPDRIASQAGRTRTRLLQTPSLWLELLVALLLALLLGGLSVGAERQVEHLVVVLDDSASMGAMIDGASCADRTRRAVEKLCAQAAGDAMVTIVLTGPSPRILAGPRSGITMANKAMAQWQPMAAGHDPGVALHLGVELAGAGGSLYFFSDTPEAVVPDRCHYRSLGRSRPNLAILGGRRKTAGKMEKVYLELAAWATAPVPVSVDLELLPAAGKGWKRASRDLTITPGKPRNLIMTVPASRLPIRVRISPDPLLVDNELTLLPTPLRPVKAAVALAEKTSRRLSLERAFATLPGVEKAAPAAAHLLFTAGKAVADQGAIAQVILMAVGKEKDSWRGPYLVHKAHELMDGVDLEDVIWTAGRNGPPGEPLVSASGQVLLSQAREVGQRRLYLNLDPERSNLQFSVAWPVFLYNLVAAVRAKLPGPGRVNLQVGELITYRRSPGSKLSKGLDLHDPLGRKRTGRGARLLTWEASLPGIHELRGKEGTLARWSVHFCDPGESKLTDRGPGEVKAKKESSRLAGEALAGIFESRILALLLLVILALNWWLLARGGE